MNEPSTILIAEDDEFLARMYQQKLLIEGYRVLLARDGEQALQYLMEEVLDAMLLDIVMPKRSGFEVLTMIRSSKGHKNGAIPVLVVSNLSHEQAIHQSMLTGANDYIVKPGSTPAEVVSILKKLLSNNS